ncbi:CvpA family protein [Candidatus Daviesbacteria bacterium]|nr:CvpA family protein [Candidatus Daviesbacteria bacterium]
MNWIDLIILGILLLFLLEGLGKSFLNEVFNFFSFLISFFLSLRFYNLLGNFFEQQFAVPHSLSAVLGFVGVWFIVESILLLIITLLISRNYLVKEMDNFLRPFSFIPSLLRGLIFIAILLVLIGSFPIQPKVKKAVNESKIGSFILVRAQSLEAPLKNVFGGISSDTLTFLTVKPQSNQSITLGFQTDEFSPNEQLEVLMLERVTKERTSIGLKPYEFAPQLLPPARDHSGDMLKRGYFSHYSPEGESVADRVKKYNINYLIIGENLAYAPTLDSAHLGLMRSEGHKANILSSDFNRIAIGIMDGGVYGLMITQVFSN